MKRCIFLSSVLVVSIVFPLQASITDVVIQPATPTLNDDISLLIDGVESGGVAIVGYSFTIDGASIELDIDFQETVLTVVTPWSHSENIGLLPIGTYDITVNALFNFNPSLNDTYLTSFEVVPEPTTLALLGLGGLFSRRRK